MFVLVSAKYDPHVMQKEHLILSSVAARTIPHLR